MIKINGIEIEKNQLNRVPYFWNQQRTIRENEKMTIKYDNRILIHIFIGENLLNATCLDNDKSLNFDYSDQYMWFDLFRTLRELGIPNDKYLNNMVDVLNGSMDSSILISLYQYLKDKHQYIKLIKNIKILEDPETLDLSILVFCMTHNPQVILNNYEKIETNKLKYLCKQTRFCLSEIRMHEEIINKYVDEIFFRLEHNDGLIHIIEKGRACLYQKISEDIIIDEEDGYYLSNPNIQIREGMLLWVPCINQCVSIKKIKQSKSSIGRAHV